MNYAQNYCDNSFQSMCLYRTLTLKEWMQMKAPAQAISNIKGLLSRKKVGIVTKSSKNEQLLEDKFKLENFDLIVWEYVTENKNL